MEQVAPEGQPSMLLLDVVVTQLPGYTARWTDNGTVLSTLITSIRRSLAAVTEPMYKALADVVTWSKIK
jgi:hypothetical protein